MKTTLIQIQQIWSFIYCLFQNYQVNFVNKFDNLKNSLHFKQRNFVSKTDFFHFNMYSPQTKIDATCRIHIQF